MDQDTSETHADEKSMPSIDGAQQSTDGLQMNVSQKPVIAQHPRGRIDHEHPIGGEMSDIVGGLFTRLRLPWLMQHHTRVSVLALFSFINGCISIGLMSTLALITHTPFTFPSLGPTAFLFFYTPATRSLDTRSAYALATLVWL